LNAATGVERGRKIRGALFPLSTMSIALQDPWAMERGLGGEVSVVVERGCAVRFLSGRAGTYGPTV
jgi:hypothetical protein